MTEHQAKVVRRYLRAQAKGITFTGHLPEKKEDVARAFARGRAVIMKARKRKV